MTRFTIDEIRFAGTIDDLEHVIDNLVASYMLKEHDHEVFKIFHREPGQLGIRLQTPFDVPHEGGTTMRGSFVGEIEAHAIPAGALLTLRCNSSVHLELAALESWRVLLDRLRSEGWEVWHTSGPVIEVESADAKLQRLWADDNLTIEEIAHELGVESKDTVKRRAFRQRLPRRKRGRKKGK